jgi:hypothetical protein
MASFELGCLSETRQGKCFNCNIQCISLFLCPCNKAKYCSQDCQHRHWDVHQPDCPYGLDFVETQVCSACLSTGPGHFSCSCGTTFYCNTGCQNRHWKEHQHVCKSRIRVLLREARKTMSHVSIQCRIKRSGSRSQKHLGGDDKNPLAGTTTVRTVDFDQFENSERDKTSSEEVKRVSFMSRRESKISMDVSVFHSDDDEESSSSSGEDVDIVENHGVRKRTASTIAKAFIRNMQVLSGTSRGAISAEPLGFGANGEDDLSSHDDDEDGGSKTQPERQKIPVAVYIDMDEIKLQKKQWMTVGAHSTSRKIVRRGMLMC